MRSEELQEMIDAFDGDSRWTALKIFSIGAVAIAVIVTTITISALL